MYRVNQMLLFTLTAYFALGPTELLAHAVVFTEDFATDAANWAEGPAPFDTITHIASGGARDDGGYVSDNRSFSELGQGLLFRAHNAFDSSDDIFVANWIDEGYTQLSAYVRHTANTPLTYFARITTATAFPFQSENFPGVISDSPTVVQPGEWTKVVFDVSPRGSLTFEGGDYASLFSDVRNVQIAVNLTDDDALNTTPFTFDLDRVALSVPEPSAVALALTTLGLVACCNRNRARLNALSGRGRSAP